LGLRVSAPDAAVLAVTLGESTRAVRAMQTCAAYGVRVGLVPRGPGHDGLLDLASNDYLGLCGDKRLTVAAAEAAWTWGTGATGSRLVTGTTVLHARLEERLACSR
jgi:8-amino-7-oxononanoate synthase